MPDIYICMGSSCFSRGNAENLRVIRDYLDRHGLSATVRPMGHLCEGMCSQGPNLIVNGSLCHGVDTPRMIAILDQHLKPREKP